MVRSSASALFANRKARKIASPIVIVALWEIVSRSGLVAPYILPAPTIVLHTLIGLLVSGELLPHIAISLMRSLTGFAIGSTLGILLGITIGWSRFAEDIADVPIQVLRSTPKSALIPLIIVWLGLGELSKIFIVSLPSFFLTLINTIAGVKGVDILLIKAARSLGAKDRHILREVIVPAAAPMIFAGLRLGVVISLVLLMMAEMVAANRGLGYFIQDAQRLFLTDRMFAGIVVIGLLGFISDRIVLRIEGKLLAWHKGKTIAASR